VDIITGFWLLFYKEREMVTSIFGRDELLIMAKLAENDQKDVLKYEYFSGHEGRQRVQWSYVDKRGNFHTSISSDLETARQQAAKYGYDREVTAELQV
jgi:hypothetical protein